MWRRLFFFLALPIAILVVAFLSVQPASFDVTLLSSSSSFSWMRAPFCIRSLSLDRLYNTFLKQQQRDISTSTSKMASAGPSSTSYRTPVYFLSHGGVRLLSPFFVCLVRLDTKANPSPTCNTAPSTPSIPSSRPSARRSPRASSPRPSSSSRPTGSPRRRMRFISTMLLPSP